MFRVRPLWGALVAVFVAQWLVFITTERYVLVLLPLEECGVGAFSEAVHKLADCFPLLKPRLLKGMAACASHDEKLTATEIELLVSVAAVMDCPVPASVRIEVQA